MTQIDFRSGTDMGRILRDGLRLDVRHQVLILLIASLPVIPMPIAGGTPILIAVMVSIYALLLTFPARAVYLDRSDLLYIYLGCSLLAWEVLSLIAHPTNNDTLYVLGRGLWLTLALAVVFAMNLLYRRGGLKPVTWILVLSLLALLTAMLIEINFYPARPRGRDFGFFAIPWPRATGVPNSDGKLGTLLSICLCYVLFLRPPMPRWQAAVLIVGPYMGLAILQSRSGLVAIALITGIALLYGLMRSRSLLTAFLKLTGFLLIVGAFLVNLYWLLKILTGQGIFQTNVIGRFELYAFSLRVIPEAPLFGIGMDGMLLRGEAGTIHNTILAMAVKSGLPAAIMTALTIFAPVILFARAFKLVLFTVAVCLAIFAEHFFYPGYFNEYQIICFAVAKLAWQNQFDQRAGQA